MSHSRKAFTLIELLVVIAIIAILAAILFPVFAQAKAAAKKTTAISNAKQQALAAIMYAGDADDFAPLDATVIDAAGDNLQWQDLIQPYAKNYGIVFDAVSDNQSTTNGIDYILNFGMLPTAASVGTGSFTNYLTRTATWFQNYTAGNLQYDGIAGFAKDGGAAAFYGFNSTGSPSRSLTSIARSAETAFTFDSNVFDGWHGIYGQQIGFGYCGGWAAGQGFTADYGFFGPQPRHSGGSNICDPNTRATAYGKGSEIVTFVDGHAKSMHAGEMMKQHGTDNFLTYWWPNQ
jgi:prepilin-type N-terminal cleavage/methylation domain-containing protein